MMQIGLHTMRTAKFNSLRGLGVQVSWTHCSINEKKVKNKRNRKEILMAFLFVIEI
jgi:hypothetical protein